MAGSRQHFLPQVLLKGFASRIVGDEAYSLVFQLNKEVYEANITKIAVEREFYTDSLDLDLDKAITELESELGTMLDDLRRERSSVQIASNKMIDFMANLLARTQSLRNKVLTCADLSLDCIATHLQADPKLEPNGSASRKKTGGRIHQGSEKTRT